MSCNKTKLEQAFECVVNIYHQYCILKPVDDYLQPKEFEKLMKEQAQDFLCDTTPTNMDQAAYIKQIFKKADKDNNGHLKFPEFLCVLAATLDNAHHRSHDFGEGQKGQEHGHGHGHSH
ncbi:protein S100-A9-like [Heteronotia binoei]|uniref:protein S100-A9-like n=1 Tax=Heteronotia binoei TaxID=13085 RepID=UPI00292E6AE9|nr:protein S100-A9-like [Heteronotia binoei]